MSEILNILGSVGFNWHVALANFVNFLIILFLLNKFFFGKIGKTLGDRYRVIENGLNQAREAEIKLTQAEEEKHAIVKSAHKEKETIIAHAQSLASDIATTMKKEAQTEIDVRLEKLSQQEESFQAALEKSFGEKAPTLVARLYAKTLAKHMTEADNNELIASMKA
jgi:F-type H+-transporting ATPase subunit b